MPQAEGVEVGVGGVGREGEGEAGGYEAVEAGVEVSGGLVSMAVFRNPSMEFVKVSFTSLPCLSLWGV